MLKKIYSAGLAICLSSCSVIGINSTPEATYNTMKKQNDYAIRIYQPRMEAQVTIAEGNYNDAVNKGFRELFNYITGSNTVNQKISMTTPAITKKKSQNIDMTAPVLISDCNRAWTVAFVLPDGYTLENTPKPTNEDIKLVYKPQNKVAAISFSGFMNKDSIDANSIKLEAWISKNHLQMIGEPMAAGYNPPWTIPFLRTNEVMIEVR